MNEIKVLDILGKYAREIAQIMECRTAALLKLNYFTCNVGQEQARKEAERLVFVEHLSVAVSTTGQLFGHKLKK